MNSNLTIKILNSGGVGVIPTDTLYGIVGRADVPQTVERIYRVKERTPSKPFIILISDINDLKKFNIHITEQEKVKLDKYWPGKLSVIFNIKDEKFDYLTRGSKSLAFRLSDKKDLQDLLRQTGPLVAPSANPEGETPAETIEKAKSYFKDLIDFYIDGGILNSEPSTLISLKNGEIKVLRDGAVKI